MNSTFQRTGILFVLSAPSGAGKTTLCSALRHKPDFVYAVSCTTRNPRAGETDGEDYHFITDAEFDRRAADGEFLEHAEVHGRKYGTLKSTVLENLTAGIDVLLDIDTAGAASVRNCGDPYIADALAEGAYSSPFSPSQTAGRPISTSQDQGLGYQFTANDQTASSDLLTANYYILHVVFAQSDASNGGDINVNSWNILLGVNGNGTTSPETEFLTNGHPTFDLTVRSA